MNSEALSTLFALVRREVLEHKNVWRVPLILLVIALLFKLSLSFGNLTVDVNIPEQLQLDQAIGSAVNMALIKGLNVMNAVIMFSLFVVSVFYALASLYDERKDQSVLFWRSLPISDVQTVASKLIIAVIAIPLLIIVTQTIVAILFLGTDSPAYLGQFYGDSLPALLKLVVWILLPIISWCLLCSSLANRNPFLLAFLAPILLILVDNLFFNGMISDTLVINRLTGVNNFDMPTLLWGLLISGVCLTLAIVKRSQRI